MTGWPMSHTNSLACRLYVVCKANPKHKARQRYHTDALLAHSTMSSAETGSHAASGLVTAGTPPTLPKTSVLGDSFWKRHSVADSCDTMK